MEKKEYLVGVTIIEGRNLKGKDAAGTSDPFVRISCANLPPQVTLKKFKTNAVVWNQSFTFSELMMNQYELEIFELIIEVFDYNALMTNELIGYYSIGLSTLYRNLNHEFYRTWLTLFNPEFPNEIQGYLQVSCFIVGQNERPPAHAQDQNILDDEEEIDEEMLQGLSEEQKIQLMKKKQGIFMLAEPQMLKKGYQLSVNILKAEGLPQCDSSGQCNSFVSVRAVGAVQTTRVVEENYNPIYNSKLCYPIWLPILNDKITIRIWSQVRRGADIFIANIPEYPSAFDFFNITKILSSDGKMRSTWFNLYGVHPLERGWFSSNKVNKKEGSFYLGRVLISIQLAPNDKPQLLTTITQPVKEPTSQKFMLWVDAYDLVNCDEANGNDVWIVATIGSYSSQKHLARYRDKTNSYSWKKVSMKSLQVDYPQDLRQTPDIIINVYSEKTFKGEYRLGYIRIPARECRRKNAQPQWYRLKSPTNDKTCPGIILMNVQYIWEGQDLERFPKQRTEGSYRLFSQILQGYDLAPAYNEESLNTKVDIKIGSVVVQKEGISTEAVFGRFPVWNSLKVKDVVLDKNLQFASDMRVLLYNCTKSLILRRDQQEVLGEFCVPISSISQKLYSKPQFFNLINNDGDFQGQILARFFLKEIDSKKKKDDISGIMEEFNHITRVAFKVNIVISVFGLRNLIYFAKRPVITLRLTNDPQKRELKIRLEEILDSRNPNFGSILAFKNVELPFEPLLWPQLEITVIDEGNSFGLGGCEQCYTIFPIFEFADFLREEDINFGKAQLNKNQNKLQLVQRQINPQLFYQQLQNQKQGNAKPIHTQEEEERDLQRFYENDGMIREEFDEDGNALDVSNNDFGINMVGGLRIKELDQSQEINKRYIGVLGDDDEEDEEDDADRKGVVDVRDVKLELNKRGSKLKPDQRESKRISNLGGGRDNAANMRGASSNGLDSQQDLLGNQQRGAAKKNPKSGQVNNVDLDNMIELVCTPQLKLEEEQIRQAKIKELEKKSDKLMLQIQNLQTRDKKELKKAELMEVKNMIQQLQEEKMTEQKFWGYVMDEANGQEEFQYGREVIREGTYEKYLRPPYKSFPLFTNNGNGAKTAQVGGLLRSGQLTGASIKAAIKVKRCDDNSDSSSDSENESARDKKKSSRSKGQYKENKLGKTAGGSDSDDSAEMEFDDQKGQLDKNEEDKETLIFKKIFKKYPFDLTKERFMRSILVQKQNFKIRVYLLTCQNLSAIDSYLDLKSKLAGLQARCSADPFPVIIVGDGKNDTQEQKVKYINERDKEVKQDLNPKFFRSYEFDASFPEDWKIEIQIQDKGRLSYTDALIGSTVIDLEDRYYGNFRKQVADSLELYKELAQKEILLEDRKEQPDQRYILERKKKIDKIVKEIAQLKAIEQKPVAVEFRELRHPNKKQVQGMIEMWVEVLTQEEARRLPMSRLQVQNKEEYEIRLIIWETRDIPLVNGESVDIFCKVSFDPTGWAGNEIEKTTDVHYGSKDGRGIFNYRFLFDVQTPCEFPRLKFQIYDYGLINDEAIGEAILNLKKTMAMLQKEGRLDIPKTWLSFFHPNRKNEDCGQLLVSMQILSKAEAESSPVGEAQDDPNENPKLEKPTEGRGLADKIITVTNVDVTKFRLPKLNMFRNFIIIGIVFAVVVIILILIMFLKKAQAKSQGQMKKVEQAQENLKDAKAKKQLDIQAIEEELAGLESDDEEIELLKKKINKKHLLNDVQWKFVVAIVGSGLALALTFLTLYLVELLLKGGGG